MRTLALLRRVGSELLLLGYAVAICARLSHRGRGLYAALVLIAGLAVVLAALAWMRERGTLPLAWRCPRLDLGGLRLRSGEAPWEVLVLAEQVLELLASVGRYRSFFPEAERAVRVSAARAVALGARPRADAQRHEELARIERTLQAVRGHLVRTVARAPERAGELDALLEGLEQRSSALAEAVIQVSAECVVVGGEP